jgi:purine-cytosine permease-like protein
MTTVLSKNLISWKQLSPIFADVVLSPWNLLVGGLLIKYLSITQAALSIAIGYGILALIFVLYGGLGFKKRMQSAEILDQIFRGKFSQVFIPLLLAIGQLGWAAINISLGGGSLAILSNIPIPLGMAAYALIIGIMASLKLHQLAFSKLLVIITSLSLLTYIGVVKLSHTAVIEFLKYQPSSPKSLFWGISVVVASLISFATVSPDFFQSAEKKTDILPSTILGIVLPGSLMCFMGCLFFYDRSDFNLVGLIGGLSFAALPHIFNGVTNTDGSMAIYTPALKFRKVFNIKLPTGVLLGTLASLVLAVLGITHSLETWLKVLSLMSPIFIGVAYAAVVFNNALPQFKLSQLAKLAYFVTALVCIALLKTTLPVIFALIMPLIIYSIYLQYRIIHE